jgi:hypothetical protein
MPRQGQRNPQTTSIIELYRAGGNGLRSRDYIHAVQAPDRGDNFLRAGGTARGPIRSNGGQRSSDAQSPTGSSATLQADGTASAPQRCQGFRHNARGSASRSDRDGIPQLSATDAPPGDARSNSWRAVEGACAKNPLVNSREAAEMRMQGAARHTANCCEVFDTPRPVRLGLKAVEHLPQVAR